MYYKFKGADMIFILKQYDFELLTFELCQDSLNGFECSVLSTNEANRKLLPPGMTADGEGVLAWLRHFHCNFVRHPEAAPDAVLHLG